MNVWIRGRSASLIAPQAASMSALCVRASPQITGPSTVRAIASTASKSPGEVIGKPASITSTPRRASWLAISTFSWVFSEIPGDCSPSRSVVSKMSTRSARRPGTACFGGAHRTRYSFSRILGLPCLLRLIAPPSAIPPGGGGEGEARGWSAGGSSGRDSSGDGETCNHHGSCFPMNRDKIDSRTVFRIVAVAIADGGRGCAARARRHQDRHDHPLVRDGGLPGARARARPSS